VEFLNGADVEGLTSGVDDGGPSGFADPHLCGRQELDDDGGVVVVSVQVTVSGGVRGCGHGGFGG